MAINQPLPQKKIRVEVYYDGFAIVVDDTRRFMFDQEDDMAGLVEVFKELGYNNVSSQECY